MPREDEQGDGTMVNATKQWIDELAEIMAAYVRKHGSASHLCAPERADVGPNVHGARAPAWAGSPLIPSCHDF
jgi:hypothetical protein